MTNDAFPVIFCMESSDNVIKSAQTVCNCVSLHHLWINLCLSKAHSDVRYFSLHFPCSVRDSTLLSWTGTP